MKDTFHQSFSLVKDPSPIYSGVGESFTNDYIKSSKCLPKKLMNQKTKKQNKTTRLLNLRSKHPVKFTLIWQLTLIHRLSIFQNLRLIQASSVLKNVYFLVSKLAGIRGKNEEWSAWTWHQPSSEATDIGAGTGGGQWEQLALTTEAVGPLPLQLFINCRPKIVGAACPPQLRGCESQRKTKRTKTFK